MYFELTKLGDICKIGSSKRIKREDYVQNGIPFFRSKEVIELSKGNSISTELFISNDQYDQINYKFGSPNVGDILITSVGTLGVAYQVKQDQLPFYFKDGNLTWLSHFSEEVNPRWIFYWLNSPEGQQKIEQISIGSTQKAITIVALKSIKIQLPHKDEQSRTVHVLDSITDKININTQINQTLEQIAQALFKSWFVDFDPVKAKIAVLEAGGTAEAAELAAMGTIAAKSPEQLADMQQSQPEAYQQLTQTAALFPSAMQNSELGQIPEGWGISSIDKSFKVVMGQSPKGDTYNDRGDGTLFYQGRAEFGWRFPSPRLYTTDPKRMANKGDVLMSIRAPVGDLNIALNDCCVGRGLCSLRHDSGSTTYTYYLLKQLQIKFDTFSGEGTVFGSINQKDLKSIQFIAPVHEIINAYIGLAAMFR